MMGALLFLGVVALLATSRFGDAAAWLVTLGFIAPFFVLGGGTLAWAVGVVLDRVPFSGAGWLACVTGVGLPLGGAISLFVLRR